VPETFQETVAELGLLAATVVALAFAVYLLRRTRDAAPPT
jgi:hypothetical protein